MNNIKRYSSVLVILIILVTLSAIVIGCGGDGDETEQGQAGQLPDIKIGDRWEYNNVRDGVETRITMEVIEGDTDGLLTVRMTLDPPVEGMIGEAIAGFDRELLLPLWTKMSGEAEGTAFTAETESTYEITSGSRWPLEVGKEVTITETTVTNIAAGDDTHTETETETSTYEVEAIEEITVEAGTFECFRSVKYNEAGEKLKTSWFSDEVKIYVKEIDHEAGETQELVSYSVK